MRRNSHLNILPIQVRTPLLACGVCLVATLVVGSINARAAESVPDYLREVQPILSQYCFKCHGPDQESRQANLRLDRRDAAMEGGESDRPAIVPGHPESSMLITRLLSENADEVMPPPAEKISLTPSQIDILKRWIAGDAEYSKHWSFVAPTQRSLPENVHPIDAIVRSTLEEKGLQVSPREEEAVLARRLYLDVIGLPPTPEEVAQYKSVGLDVTIEKLFRNERHGEKWARHWLDVARYSDSNGFERDYPREQWAWRDWVVKAINTDMPYNQFILEQIAGDLLPERTQEQMVATGFLRNSMTNEEGAIVPEQFRMEEMFDRLDCIGKGVLGLTLQCAQCHSHKFDPISQEEYYGVFAFLNNTFEARSSVYTQGELEQIATIKNGIQAAEERLRAARPNWRAEMQAWSEKILAQQPKWVTIDPQELDSTGGMNHPTKEPGLSILTQGSTSAGAYVIATAEPDLEGVTGLRLEALPHDDLAFGGPGRGEQGTWVLSELQVSVRRPGDTEDEKLKLSNATADFSQPEHPEPTEWNAKTKNGEEAPVDKPASKKVARLCGPVSLLIDGKVETSWRADRGAGRRNVAAVAVVCFPEALHLPPGTKMKVSIHLSGGLWPYSKQLGHTRLSLTKDPKPQADSIDHDAILAMQIQEDHRTPAEQTAVFMAWRASVVELQAFNDEIESLWHRFPEASNSVLHLAERGPFHRRDTMLLDRGIWDKPSRLVAPHVLASLHPFPENARLDRLGFAQWLIDARSPLAARVAVNRVWQSVFGTGLVETSEDFGTRTPVPLQQALLDWLAVDFMEHGWSQRHLLRTILTSAAYQQRSAASPEMIERDPHNQLLARGPRFRLDAEVVRDLALSISGLLKHRSGGAPIFPPVPQSVLDFNYVKPDYWKPPEGADRYLRSLYLFRKRSMPDPMLSSFDAPSSDFACARRLRSNTAIASLAGLNETMMVEAARAFALRVLREGGATDTDRADYAFRLCAARAIQPVEIQKLLELITTTRQRIADGWLNPREIATGDSARLPVLPPNTNPQDAAAWMIAARVLLNLDETLTKN